MWCQPKVKILIFSFLGYFVPLGSLFSIIIMEFSLERSSPLLCVESYVFSAWIFIPNWFVSLWGKYDVLWQLLRGGHRSEDAWWYMASTPKMLLKLCRYYMASWKTKPYFILIVGGPIGRKTMPPFNTNPNKNTRVIFLVKIFQQTERNGAKNYLDVLSKPQTICIKSCMVL